jgi:hypothetical protein
MTVTHRLLSPSNNHRLNALKKLPVSLAIAAVAAALIAGFVVVVLVCGALWWFGSDGGRSAIEGVLRQDKTLEAQVEAQVRAGTPAIEAAHAYVSEIDKIDLRNCPDDFAQAYVRHRAAWRGLVAQVDSEPNSWLGAFIAGGINLLGGEADGGAGRVERADLAAKQAVRDTWADVEAAAARHHALIPTAP